MHRARITGRDVIKLIQGGDSEAKGCVPCYRTWRTHAEVNRGYHQVFRVTRDAIGKDGHQSWAKGNASAVRSEGRVRPASRRIHRKECDLAVIDAPQLHDRVIARRI